MNPNQKVSNGQIELLLEQLQKRFESHMHRHQGMFWSDIAERIYHQPPIILSLFAMEESGGEPDVVEYDSISDRYHFFDCSPESPVGRRNLCYDEMALASRKKFRPSGSALGMASEMGIELLTPEHYRRLQQTGTFDAKTSSWLLTPTDIREKGGALFGDFRFGHVFLYHNGAESYYGVRGFRGLLRV